MKPKSKKSQSKSKTTKSFVPKRPNINLLISMAVLIIALFLAVFQTQQSQDPRGRAQVTNCTVSSADMAMDSEETVLLAMINNYRVQQGVPSLQLSTTLTRSAAWLSNDMAQTGNISHTDSLNRYIFVRWMECGHPDNSGGEENIYGGSPSAQAAFEFWQNSVMGHKEVMLNSTYRYAGVARKGNYWTFTASGLSGEADPGTTVSPPTATTTVPSPACLGSCPSESPSPSVDPSGSVAPSDDPTPSVTIDPSATPDPSLSSTPDPSLSTTPGTSLSGTPTPGGTPQQGGIIAWFLALLLLIFQFFASLFGK